MCLLLCAFKIRNTIRNNIMCKGLSEKKLHLLNQREERNEGITHLLKSCCQSTMLVLKYNVSYKKIKSMSKTHTVGIYIFQDKTVILSKLSYVSEL